MFFSIKQRLAHIDLICLIVTGRVKLKPDVTLVLRLGIVWWKVVVRLESLVVRIDLLDVRSCNLKIKVYKTF